MQKRPTARQLRERRERNRKIRNVLGAVAFVLFSLPFAGLLGAVIGIDSYHSMHAAAVHVQENAAQYRPINAPVPVAKPAHHNR
jgi:hypothetical protein